MRISNCEFSLLKCPGVKRNFELRILLYPKRAFLFDAQLLKQKIRNSNFAIRNSFLLLRGYWFGGSRSGVGQREKLIPIHDE